MPKDESIVRPEIKCTTIDRLKNHGEFAPNTSVDWMINFALDKLEKKK
jgi:hypothetical protein